MLSYEPLGLGQIRVLQILPGSHHSQLLECRLHHVLLPQTKESGQQWPDIARAQYDNATIFDHHLIFWPTMRRYRQRMNMEYERIQEPTKTTAVRQDLGMHYLALSYVWGSPKQTRAIVVNGCSVNITENLFAALEQLRRSPPVEQGLRIWADAICIDQSNLVERAQQVGIMREIYADAWQVVIWLGRDTLHSARAFAAVRWLAEQRYADHQVPFMNQSRQSLVPIPFGVIQVLSQRNAVMLSPRVSMALHMLFTTPYWHRLWILQEVANAKPDAPVYWGSNCIGLHEIQLAAQFIEANEPWFGRRITTPAGMGLPMHMFPGEFLRDRDLDSRDTVPSRLWKRTLRIFALQQQNYKAEASILAAFDSFDLARSASATDERDKVFGMLGLQAVRAAVAGIIPDYTQSLQEVYTSFSREVLLGGDTNILRLVHSPIDSLCVSWKFKFEPLDLSKRLKLQYYNPFWPPENLKRNLQILRSSASGQRLEGEGIAPCDHGLASWAVCWSCSSAPTAPLPPHFHADRGLSLHGVHHVSFAGGVMSAQAVFIDEIASLSAFHMSEYDLSFPQSVTRNAALSRCRSIEDVRESLWRTLLADTSPGLIHPAQSHHQSILENTHWKRPLRNRLISMVQTELGLPSFLHRNASLELCGYHFQDLLVTSQARDASHSVTPATDTEMASVVSRAANLLAWRRLVSTKADRLGLTTAATRHGDQVAVVVGCQMPLVLRPYGRRWSIVGECYIHDMMDGQAGELLLRGEVSLTEIEIE